MKIKIHNFFAFAIQSTLCLPRFLKKTIALIFDIFLCLVALWIAFSLRLDNFSIPLDILVLPAIIAILFLIPIFTLLNVYSEVLRCAGKKAFFNLAKAIGMFGVLYTLIFTVIGVENIPRSIGVLLPVILAPIMVGSRIIVGYTLVFSKDKSTNNSEVTPVLIYGAGVTGRQLAEGLKNETRWKLLGFLDDDSNFWGGNIDGYPVFDSSQIEELIKKNSVKELWIAISDSSQNEIQNTKIKNNSNQRLQIIESVRKLGLHVRSIPSFYDVASGRVRVSDIQELDVNDLLNRPSVMADKSMLERNIFDRVVLVTGAGGTIGSELCRQIIKLKPLRLIMVDHSEHALYLINLELTELLNKEKFSNEEYLNYDNNQKILPILASVTDETSLSRIFKTWKPNTVFHAAAFKHVGLVEQNISVALINNIWGTYNCAQQALKHNTNIFVLVSTDKAVRPTNIMGASKRLAEMIVQGFAAVNLKNRGVFCSVRFGNVLGSSGSVLPLFREQIAKGGPVTVTHPDVTRYFMTVTEAAELVIQAGSMASGGEVFVLDMGEPVRIYEFARRVIQFSGRSVRDNINPNGDIPIKIIGLRPGEKLYEELLIRDKPESTLHPKIMKVSEDFLPLDQLKINLDLLRPHINLNDIIKIRHLLRMLVHQYTPANKVIDLEWRFNTHEINLN